MDDLGFDCDIEALVLSRARRALEAGCDGVISSGLEVARLRQEVDDRLLVITPGIRPVDNRPEGDPKRVVTVETAFSNGAEVKYRMRSRVELSGVYRRGGRDTHGSFQRVSAP